MNRHFDAIVIGAGQAGPAMVGRLAAASQTVALIERDGITLIIAWIASAGVAIALLSLSHAAFDTIRAEAGHQFDPACVVALEGSTAIPRRPARSVRTAAR